jgi:hypothetical protein
MQIMDWWCKHQSIPLGYILENVPPLGDIGIKVVEDGQYLCQILGSPIFLDVVAVHFYAHQPQCFWTNSVPHHLFYTSLDRIPMPMGHKVDYILDDNRFLLLVRKDNSMPLALVNKVGAPCGACISYLSGFLPFQTQRPGMVWDANTCTYEEPYANEHDVRCDEDLNSMYSVT